MEAASINHVEVDSGGENERENNVAEEWTSDNILWRLKQQSPKPSSQRSRSANGNHNAHYINIILIKIKISVCCCRYLHSSRASPSLAAGSTSAVLFSNESDESRASTATVVQCFFTFLTRRRAAVCVRRAISTVWRVAPVIRQPVIIYYLKLNFPWQCDASASRASKHQQTKSGVEPACWLIFSVPVASIHWHHLPVARIGTSSRHRRAMGAYACESTVLSCARWRTRKWKDSYKITTKTKITHILATDDADQKKTRRRRIRKKKLMKI